MTVFSYILEDRANKKLFGRIEAGSREEAASAIKTDGWYICQLKDEAEESPVTRLFHTRPKFSAVEKIILTDHLASMIQSGTPLIEALETFQEEEAKKQSLVIRDIIGNVKQGKKLSEALKKYSYIFSSYYTSLVAAGELSGRLDETFLHLATELRREYEFRERIKSALIYPVLVLTAALAVIILLITVVIPKITELTKSFGGELPLATRIVAGAATVITNYSGIVAALLAIGIGSVMYILRSPKHKKMLEPSLLKIPLIGTIMRNYILARMLRLIGSCLQYGIALTTTFDAVSDVIDHVSYRTACGRIKQRIVKGTTLAKAFRLESKELFPSLIVRSLKAGEKTGSVDQALLRLSTFYEADVDRNLKRMTDLIEPVLTIILGVIVGAIALSVIGPIYQLTSKIR